MALKSSSVKLMVLFGIALTTLSQTSEAQTEQPNSAPETTLNNLTDSTAGNQTLGAEGGNNNNNSSSRLGRCGWWGGGGGGCGWIEVDPNDPQNDHTEAPFVPNVPPPFPMSPSDKCRGDGNPCLPDCDICSCSADICDCCSCNCNCNSCNKGPCRGPSGPTCEDFG